MKLFEKGFEFSYGGVGWKKLDDDWWECTTSKWLRKEVVDGEEVYFHEPEATKPSYLEKWSFRQTDQFVKEKYKL